VYRFMRSPICAQLEYAPKRTREHVSRWMTTGSFFFFYCGGGPHHPLRLLTSIASKIVGVHPRTAYFFIYPDARAIIFFIPKTAAASVFTGDLRSRFIMRSIRAADDNITVQRGPRPSVNRPTARILLFFRRIFMTFLPAKK